MPIKSPSPFFIQEITVAVIFIIAYGMTKNFMSGNDFLALSELSLGLIFGYINIILVNALDT